MLAAVANCGGVGNGAAEEDWRWGLNPGEAVIWCLFFGARRLFGDHVAWVSCWLHTALVEWGPRGLGESQDRVALEVFPF